MEQAISTRERRTGIFLVVANLVQMFLCGVVLIDPSEGNLSIGLGLLAGATLQAAGGFMLALDKRLGRETIFVSIAVMLIPVVAMALRGLDDAVFLAVWMTPSLLALIVILGRTPDDPMTPETRRQ